MVEQRANLDYGADDTSLEDDLTHTPAPTGDDAIAEGATYVSEEVVIVEADEVLEEENPEASTYGAP